MKKFMRLLAIVLALLMVMVPVTACNVGNEIESDTETETGVHIHQWGEWVDSSNVITCRSTTYGTRACSLCGEEESGYHYIHYDGEGMDHQWDETARNCIWCGLHEPPAEDTVVYVASSTESVIPQKNLVENWDEIGWKDICNEELLGTVPTLHCNGELYICAPEEYYSSLTVYSEEMVCIAGGDYSYYVMQNNPGTYYIVLTSVPYEGQGQSTGGYWYVFRLVTCEGVMTISHHEPNHVTAPSLQESVYFTSDIRAVVPQKISKQAETPEGTTIGDGFSNQIDVRPYLSDLPILFYAENITIHLAEGYDVTDVVIYDSDMAVPFYIQSQNYLRGDLESGHYYVVVSVYHEEGESKYSDDYVCHVILNRDIFCDEILYEGKLLFVEKQIE